MFKKIYFLSMLIFTTNSFAKMIVTTTIYPLYSIAKAVGDESIVLNNLIPFGVEAHSFDPKPSDMTKLSNSDIFITSGNLMEPWKDKIVKALKIEDKVFDMSNHVKLREISEHNNENDKHEHKHESNIDPHYWVSLNNYILMTKAITKLFIEKDPENKDIYSKNSDNYLQKIEVLKDKYDSNLRNCTNKKILVNHDAFGYFAQEYDVKQYSISGLTPDSKPSAKVISELINLVKNEKINTVFFEEFASPKVAQAIAKETGAIAQALRPAENISKNENKRSYGYLEIMEDNLEKLKYAMNCN